MVAVNMVDIWLDMHKVWNVAKNISHGVFKSSKKKSYNGSLVKGTLCVEIYENQNSVDQKQYLI